MDNDSPVQESAVHCCPFSRLARRAGVVLLLLYVVSFAVSWWLMPIKPYATLNLDNEMCWVLFSPDGTMLATLPQRGPFKLWDVASGRERFSIAQSWQRVETVLFSPDNKFVAAHELGGDVKLWSTTTGDEIRVLHPETPSFQGPHFQFSPDSRFLVSHKYNDTDSPNKEYITFWDIETRREFANVEGGFHTLAYAPDGKSFATCLLGGDLSKVTDVIHWRIDKAPVMAKQHRISAARVAFSPDLTTFVTGENLANGMGQIAKYDMLTGEKQWSVTFKQFGTELWSLSFLADGKVLSARGGIQWEWRDRTTLWMWRVRRRS